MAYLCLIGYITRKRHESKDQKTYQIANHRIPLSDIQSVEIVKLDKNRTAYAGILAGLGATLFTLAIITGDIDLLFFFLDLI